MNKKNTLINISLFLSSLSLLYFSFPATHWSNYLLIWIAFVPLLLLLSRIDNLKSRFIITWGFFQLFFILLFRVNPFNLYTSFYQPGNFWGTLFLVVSIPLPYAVITLFISLISEKPLLAAAIWTITEIIVFQHLLNYPMAAATTQFNNLTILQLCSITGIYGLSFLIIFFNASLFDCLRNKQKSSFLNLCIATLIIILALAYGTQRLQKKEQQKNRSYSLALIQPNHSWTFSALSQQNKLFKEQYFNNYLTMTKQTIRKDQPDLILWPEGALKTGETSKAIEQIKKFKQDIVFGGFFWDQQTKKIQNSIYSYSAKQKYLSLYSKEKLTPFFESGLFHAKNNNHPFSLKNNQLIVGPLVCFEALFSSVAKNHVSQGANILICLSDDSFFKGSNLVFLHAVYMIFRAVEFSRPAVFLNNNGFSLVVNKFGQIKLISPFEQAAISQADIIPNHTLTFYYFYPNFTLAICLAVVLFFIVKEVAKGKGGQWDRDFIT